MGWTHSSLAYDGWARSNLGKKMRVKSIRLLVSPTKPGWIQPNIIIIIYNIISIEKQKIFFKKLKGYFKIFVIFSHVFPIFFA
jgi:hypothetical protein